MAEEPRPRHPFLQFDNPWRDVPPVNVSAVEARAASLHFIDACMMHEATDSI